MPLLDDLIAETTASTGTGTVSLDGAQSGYSRFRDFHGDGDRVGYAVFVPGGDFERGLGRLIYGAPDTITRDVVLVSSNGNTSLVNFGAGTKQITGSFQTAVGSRIAALGIVRAHRNGTNQIITAGVNTKIQFTTEDHDDDGVFDAATNHRYQPVLAGLYRLRSQALMNGETNTLRQLKLTVNGTTVISQHQQRPNSANNSTLVVDTLHEFNGHSDYVEAFVQINGTGSKTVNGNKWNTYFEAHRIG